MRREEVVEICDREVLDKAAKLFGTQKADLSVFPDYEGAVNLVYEYEKDGIPLILRLSFTPERSTDQIRAEIHYINYLSDQGVRVSKPVTSKNGHFVEVIQTEGIEFRAASFIKGGGMRVPDNGYRYREDAPIEEYFHNWGKILGQMHAATRSYRAPNARVHRPDWFELHSSRLSIANQLPEHLTAVGQRIQSTLKELKFLPRSPDSYGLIHGDFNDGNFTVDYSNGDITVFDFDDACYFWFVYELASAWEGGVGRVMFCDLKERKAFMDRYMDQVMDGYNRENSLADEWLDRISLFIKVIQIEEFLHYVQYIHDPDETIQASINYKIQCIEDEIPYMGFFDSIYSPERPFSLVSH